MNILEQIVRDKKSEVEINLAHIQKSDLIKRAEDKRIPLNVREHLNQKSLSIIAEVKKASPSKGLIRSDFDPVKIATSYQLAGADCISVLTEKKYFQGSCEFLVNIRKNVSCPILRKDFMVDERQIRESYDMGADAILLIVSVLNKVQLVHFKKLAAEFGLTCLVEIHTEQELELALNLNFDLIGINNRNLTTFETHLSHSISLKKQIPEFVTTVSESGIKTAEDCQILLQAGFNAILVGETLMRKPDPGQALIDLMSKVR